MYNTTQGAIEIEKKETNRIEESILTTKPKEKLAIQMLVTFPKTTATPSQDLYRPSVEAMPLQSSRLSPRISNTN